MYPLDITQNIRKIKAILEKYTILSTGFSAGFSAGFSLVDILVYIYKKY
jgi:hypothetical protein